jgi:hypothetical protein
MKLRPPFIISARLLPALKIGDVTLSLDDRYAHGDRDVCTFYFDGPDFAHTDVGLSVLPGTPAQRCFESMLSFLGAAAEAWDRPDSDNRTLFPPAVMQWANENSSEIYQVESDLEHNPNLITEA